ncbi:MAG: type II secretion system protein GspM [Pseudomonadales bacterium]
MQLDNLWQQLDGAARMRMKVLAVVIALLALALILKPFWQEYRQLQRAHSLQLDVLQQLERKAALIGAAQRHSTSDVEQQLRNTLAGSSLEVIKFNTSKNNWQILVSAAEPAFWQWLALLRDLPVSLQGLQLEQLEPGYLKVNLEFVRAG